ncbi:hypothetical protein B0H19DRAFT_1235575 [Mycena capillaripes]|nr:hypothetical protein B0H19DRAFT_1235575 [Mycena capillaripes]
MRQPSVGHPSYSRAFREEECGEIGKEKGGLPARSKGRLSRSASADGEDERSNARAVRESKVRLRDPGAITSGLSRSAGTHGDAAMRVPLLRYRPHIARVATTARSAAASAPHRNNADRGRWSTDVVAEARAREKAEVGISVLGIEAKKIPFKVQAAGRVCKRDRRRG